MTHGGNFTMKRGVSILVLLIAMAACVIGLRQVSSQGSPPMRQAAGERKLYWFIPDGMRAEPFLFKIYEWAQAGELPHIKQLMERGSYGYARPTFPTHTPTNFASLLTGTYPERHGVTDGPMHVEGRALDKVAIGGFSSVAKKVPPIWMDFEKAGKTVSLLSVPGSTPPELVKGNTFRGRWGGWGADFHALLFESTSDPTRRLSRGRRTRLFFVGRELTRQIEHRQVEGWDPLPPSSSPAFEVVLEGWGETIYAVVTDSTDDGQQNYDHVSFSLDKQRVVAALRQGEESDWIPVTLTWRTQDGVMAVNTECRLSVIKLADDGQLRIRVFYNNLNKWNTSPPQAATQLLAKTGPMVDFVDNFPPQLIYEPSDKQAFLRELDASLAWHRGAVSALIDTFRSDVIIHDTYSPNQMLTSRWWMGFIDPQSRRYHAVSEDERKGLWADVKGMYRQLDEIVGEIMAHADEHTYVVLSSDHGVVPLDRWVHLNNFFAKQGWLSFTRNPTTGEPSIDWEHTQVVYLKMAHVYIRPDGLTGPYRRDAGNAYEALRQRVAEALRALQDANGVQPVVAVVNWEEAQEVLRLSPDRVGDLVIANAPGYGWNEELTEDLSVFSEPLESGYKQAILSEEIPGMWTPFMIAGPGIKPHHFLGDQPVEMVDQYPTIMKALGQDIPEYVQGKVLDVFAECPN